MLFRNFKINKDHISFDYESYYFDLHNCFDLEKFEFNIFEKSIVLKWKKSEDDWVSTSEPSQILVKFENVINFQISKQDNDLLNYPNEEKCLSSIGFCNWNEQEDFGYIDDINESPYDTIRIELQSWRVFKIQCESALIEVIFE